MLAVLSPAKNILLDHLRTLSKGEIMRLQSVSSNIADLNHERFQQFVDDKTGTASAAIHDRYIFKQAGLVFDGPAYRGLDIATLSSTGQMHAQKHIRLLSGLYGYLRPGDLIQEYRLEMGTKFSSGPVKTLYEFWGETVTQAINDELTLQVKYLDHNLCAIKTDSSNQQTQIVPQKYGMRSSISKTNKSTSTPIDDRCPDSVSHSGKKLLINIASEEYFKVVRKDLLDADVTIVDCVFKDKGKIVSVYAKRARGLMARYIAVSGVICGGAETMDILSRFDYEGYCFVPSESSQTRLVFNRTSIPSSTSSSTSSSRPACAKQLTGEVAPEEAAAIVAADVGIPKKEIKTESDELPAPTIQSRLKRSSVEGDMKTITAADNTTAKKRRRNGL